MSDIKTRSQGIETSITSRDLNDLAARSSSIYESLVIISTRAKQLNSDLKFELNAKLNEFAQPSDTIEEVMENKEQIEISKFYERLPNTTLIAMEEFLNGEIHVSYDRPDQ
jgi:DNA-directed RNA polymerase subunit K/omega